MADESFATGANLSGTLLDAWTNNIDGGVVESLINFEDRDKFDVLRGWPLGGAITWYAPLYTGETPLRGSFVQLRSDGTVEAATSTADITTTAPKKIMCALSSYTETSVVSSGILPLLTTNYVVRTDQIYDPTNEMANFAVGDPVGVSAGLLVVLADVNDQAIGFVRGKNTVNSTLDIEVN